MPQVYTMSAIVKFNISKLTGLIFFDFSINIIDIKFSRMPSVNVMTMNTDISLTYGMIGSKSELVIKVRFDICNFRLFFFLEIFLEKIIKQICFYMDI